MSQALRSACRQMATTPSARDWPAPAIAASHPPHAANGEVVHQQQSASAKAMGWALGLSTVDTRDAQMHARAGNSSDT